MARKWWTLAGTCAGLFLSGLLILPITIPMIFISPLSGRLIGHQAALAA
jgi:hypothetical protein